MRRLNNRVWLFLTCVLLLAPGCFASTRMTSVSNSEWVPRAVGPMLVWVVSEDLNVRRAMEEEFEGKGVDYDIEIIPALNVFFPGESYSEDEVRETSSRRGITAILYLASGAKGTEDVQLPSTTTTQCTLWTGSPRRCAQTRETTSGGGSASLPWAEYSIDLIDATDGMPIWTATATSGGNVFADQDNLRKSLVGKTLEQLREDGILRRP